MQLLTLNPTPATRHDTTPQNSGWYNTSVHFDPYTEDKLARATEVIKDMELWPLLVHSS